MPASAPRVSSGHPFSDKENKATLAAGHPQASISPIALNGVDILPQTCALGKGEEGKEVEDDELAKHWHKARGLSLPLKPLKGFSF